MADGHVEVARGDDLEELVDLAVEFYAEDNFVTSADQIMANMSVLIDERTARVAVVRDEPGIVAFAITTTTFGLEDGLIAELQDLFVRPRYRGRGFSRVLITDSDTWASRMGASLLEVVVAPNGLDVTHLERFYAYLGFTVEGRKIWTRSLQPSQTETS